MQEMAPSTAVNGTTNGHGPIKGINATIEAYNGPTHPSENRWANTVRPYSEADVKKLRGKDVQCFGNISITFIRGCPQQDHLNISLYL